MPGLQLFASEAHPFLRKALACFAKLGEQRPLRIAEAHLLQLVEQSIDFLAIVQCVLDMHIQRMVVHAGEVAGRIVLQGEHDLRTIVRKQEHHAVDQVGWLQLLPVHRLQFAVGASEFPQAKATDQDQHQHQRGHGCPQARSDG